MFRATVRLMVLAALLLLVVPATAQEDMGAQVEALMASEASFEYAESIVNFENEGLNIIGTLAMPTTDEAVPLVLLFHGFKGERDELPIVNTE